MAITFHAVRTVPRAAKVAVRLVTTDDVEAGIDGVAAAQLKNAGFEGKEAEVHTWPSDGRVQALVGVGAAAKADADALRRAGAAVARTFSAHTRVGVALPVLDVASDAARRALAEGVRLGAYRFLTYKSDGDAPKLRRVDVAGGSGARNQAALDLGNAVAEGQLFARDLVNEPGGTLTAPEFARRAAAMAKRVGLTVKVWDEAAIKRAKLGGLLGVNRGSTLPPRLVELTYSPKGRPKGTLALVGKGLVFDAGGLSIKTGQGMMTMKCDMGGAAAVVGAMSVLPTVAPACRVRAWVPMTDNMLGGDATRPGDVLRIRNGKTIEVLNTDAEGRLVLADALSLATEAKPDAIVDLATLTGACMVALGPKIAGLMGNDDEWLDAIGSAAERAGERVWRLPLPEDYKQQIESSVADMKNIGGSHGGALTAGLILSEFVGEGISWGHLDIAGPAWSENDEADVAKGGTGFGVRLLVELARSFSPPKKP